MHPRFEAGTATVVRMPVLIAAAAVRALRLLAVRIRSARGTDPHGDDPRNAARRLRLPAPGIRPLAAVPGGLSPARAAGAPRQYLAGAPGSSSSPIPRSRPEPFAPSSRSCPLPGTSLELRRGVGRDLGAGARARRRPLESDESPPGRSARRRGESSPESLGRGGFGAVDVALRHPRPSSERRRRSWSGYFAPLRDGPFSQRQMRTATLAAKRPRRARSRRGGGAESPRAPLLRLDRPASQSRDRPRGLARKLRRRASRLWAHIRVSLLRGEAGAVAQPARRGPHLGPAGRLSRRGRP